MPRRREGGGREGEGEGGEGDGALGEGGVGKERGSVGGRRERSCWKR